MILCTSSSSTTLGLLDLALAAISAPYGCSKQLRLTDPGKDFRLSIGSIPAQLVWPAGRRVRGDAWLYSAPACIIGTDFLMWNENGECGGCGAARRESGAEGKWG